MHPLIDAEKQKLAKKYHDDNLRVSIASYVASAILLFALLCFNISKNYDVQLMQITHLRVLVILLYFTALYIAYTVISFPFSYWSDYRLEHKYDFSTQNFRQWLSDEIKSFLVGFILGLIVFEAIYLITKVAPYYWWLWLSLIMITFSVVIANLFPVLILPLFYKTSPIENESLKIRIAQICQSAGMSVQGVFSINLSSKSTKANAAVVGLGNTKKILLGDTLINNYTEDEIVATLAHELTHYKEHHIWWLILWQALITLTMFFIFSLVSQYFYRLAGFNHVSEIAAFPLFSMIFVVLSAISRPLGSSLSRFYERKADLGALDLAKNADAYISLMAKFCNDQLTIAYPNAFVEWYKYSHPSPGKRIEFAEKWKRNSIDSSPKAL